MMSLNTIFSNLHSVKLLNIILHSLNMTDFIFIFENSVPVRYTVPFSIFIEPVRIFLPVRKVFQVHSLHIEISLPYVFISTIDWKRTRLNSSHVSISYVAFCLKDKKA